MNHNIKQAAYEAIQQIKLDGYFAKSHPDHPANRPWGKQDGNKANRYPSQKWMHKHHQHASLQGRTYYNAGNTFSSWQTGKMLKSLSQPGKGPIRLWSATVSGETRSKRSEYWMYFHGAWY